MLNVEQNKTHPWAGKRKGLACNALSWPVFQMSEAKLGIRDIRVTRELDRIQGHSKMTSI